MSCLQNENEITFKTGSVNHEDDSFGIRVTKCVGEGCKDQNIMNDLIQNLLITVFIQKEDIDFSIYGSTPVMWTFSVLTEFRIRPYYTNT